VWTACSHAAALPRTFLHKRGAPGYRPDAKQSGSMAARSPQHSTCPLSHSRGNLARRNRDVPFGLHKTRYILT